MKSYRVKNVDHLIIGSININSIRYKFEQLKLCIKDNIDILIIQETKIDESFPTNKFRIDGFNPPYRRDRTAMGGGLMVYIREHIPAKILKISDEIEGIFIELNMKGTKWLLSCIYNPNGQCSREFFIHLENELNYYFSKYDSIIIVGDFNQEENDSSIRNFSVDHGLKNIVKDKTCFKNPSNPRCIDLILTNRPKSFQHTTTFDIGLSDFHKMVVTSFKCKLEKRAPKVVSYRDYKHFDSSLFRQDLNRELPGVIDWADFEEKTLNVINQHAPNKKKTLRANHKPYITKELRKAIMDKTRLAKRRFNSEDDMRKFKRQKNFVDRESKRAMRAFYDNLDIRELQDNKVFWRTFGENVSDKVKSKQSITLVKDNNIISNEKAVADEFSRVFEEAVKNLDIPSIPFLDPIGIQDPIDRSIHKYQTHPSILKIKEKIAELKDCNLFDFEYTNEERVSKWIKSLKSGKATTFQHIPGKIIKDNEDIFTPIMTDLINSNFHEKRFPDNPKFADVHPIYKKGDRTSPGQYRPISVVTHTGKTMEKEMYDQIYTKMKGILSDKLCGYRKGFSTQHALISMTEQWRKSLDKKGFAGAVLMDLSKAFDCMNHELLIAKLNAYGFKKDSLSIINSYLSNRWQRVKVGNSFSGWTELLLGVPQGSVLGPLLFNIYLNDLIWFINGDVTNYADDTTPFDCSKDLNDLKAKLEIDSSNAIHWFKNNYMKLNTDKCKVIIAGQKDHQVSIRIGESEILEQNKVDLLGIELDNELTFSDYLNKQIGKANSKLYSIIRFKSFLNFNQKKVLLSSFVHSHFRYSPLVWMFQSRKINSKIDKVHKKALRLLYDDDESTFEELLKRDEGFTVHETNIQKLMLEMFKAKNKIEPNLLQGIFEENEYKGPTLRSSKSFKKPNVRTVRFGERSLQNLGTKLWDQIPKEKQNLTNLSVFINFIKRWRPKQCPCEICKHYESGVGYIQLFE